MWANPDLPFDPKTALPIRHPLLVAECRCWRPLRFRHVCPPSQHLREGGGKSQQYRNGPASCFNHSRSFPATSSTTTTACGHGKLGLCPAQQLKEQLRSAQVAGQWRGDTALTLPLFWRRSTVSPVFFGRFPRSSQSPCPLPTLSPSLIGHPASVDVKQHESKTESSIPQRRPGDAPLHHQPHRYSRGTPQHRDVSTAPPPFSGWYGAHRHPLRMWAAPTPQSSYGALPPR